MSVPLQFLAGAVRILLIPALCASLAFAPTARAGLVSTHDVLRQSVSLTEARARVQAVIARPEVASRLGMTTHSLYAWKQKYGPDSAEHQEKTAAEVENRRRKKELKRVTEECDLLKKAAVYFANQPE